MCVFWALLPIAFAAESKCSAGEDAVTLSVMTIATQPDPIFNVLKSTLKRKGADLVVLGDAGSLWGYQNASQFGFKLKYLAEFSHRPEHSPNDLILYMDAYDTYFNGELDVLNQRYIDNFENSIVFGAAKTDRLSSKYPAENHRHFFPFLNCGLIIGTVGTFRKYLNRKDYRDDENDKDFWLQLYLSNPDDLVIDHDNLLFFNAQGLNGNEYSINGEVVDFRGRTPQAFHTSTLSKPLIMPLIKAGVQLNRK